MVQEIVWDLLVHPFHRMITIFHYSPSEAERQIAIKNANTSFDIWQETIREASRSGKGLVLVRPNFESAIQGHIAENNQSSLLLANEALRLYNKLERFARRNLPRRCVVVSDKTNLHDTFFNSRLARKFKSGKLKAAKGIGLSMGDYYNECVMTSANYFTILTGQRVRPSISRSVVSYLTDLFSNRLELIDFSQWHSKVLARAKHITELRRRRG